MSKIRLAINGFGRIGRVVTRFIQDNPSIELVAVNDLADTKTLAHLLKYDSTHRGFPKPVVARENSIEIGDNIVYVYNSKDPEQLPWGELKIDVVIEATGIFRTKETASKHIKAGAKKVIISAPPKTDDIPSVVLGINEEVLTNALTVISNASCTTNCGAPMLKVLNDLCSIEKGYLTTVHAYTADQRLQDAPHNDLRRARSAAVSIVPTTTGAANALVKIFPELHGKLIGSAMRVPVQNGSLTELTLQVNNPKPVSEINKYLKEAADTYLKGILEFTMDPIVSTDIIGNPHSCILDGSLTSVNGDLVRIVGWYDNEAGYSNRLIDLVEKIG